jgi:mono/diheme cytochrome c family protein
VTRRIAITLLLLVSPLLVALVFSYELIKVDFTSFMEDQPGVSYQEVAAVPAPAGAVPRGGLSASTARGVPVNPVVADDVSLQRGKILFNINCTVCHGEGGKGDGPMAEKFDDPKPVDLTSAKAQALEDGEIFLTISRGFGTMMPMSENLTPRERWDVVNYVRQLAGGAGR